MTDEHNASARFSAILPLDLAFKILLTLKKFGAIIRSGIDLLIKSIFMLTVDGGPGENSRYQKAINAFLMLYFSLPMLKGEGVLIGTREK